MSRAQWFNPIAYRLGSAISSNILQNIDINDKTKIIKIIVFF